MTYKKQLSPVGAAVMGFMVSGLLIGAGLLFFAPMIVFSPIILAATMIGFGGSLLAHGLGKRGGFQNGLMDFVNSFAIAVPLSLLAILLFDLTHPAAAVVFEAFTGEDLPEPRLFLYMAGGFLAAADIAIIGHAARKSYLLTPESGFQNNELDRKGPALAAVIFAFYFMTVNLLVMPFAAATAGAVYLMRYEAKFQPCPEYEKAKAARREGRWSNHPADCDCEYCRALRESLRTGKPPIGPPDIVAICPVHRSHDKVFDRHYDSCSPNSRNRFLARAFIILAGFPPLLVGATMLRRGMWLRSLRDTVRNLPTAKVRSAAMGLVELTGVAVSIPEEESAEIVSYRSGMDGTRSLVRPFYLDDETGRALVSPPCDMDLGADERMLLARRSRQEGDLVEKSLMDGDAVYVLGELAADERGLLLIAPWRPPYSPYMVDLTNTLLYRQTSLLNGMPWSEVMGIGYLPDVFLVSDAPENEARAHLFKRIRRVMLWGTALVMSALAVAYLVW